MLLNLLNLYSLIFALFDEISTMTPRLETYKALVESNSTNSTPTDVTPDPNSLGSKCHESCSYFEGDLYVSTTALISTLVINSSLATYSKFSNTMTEKTTIAAPANYYYRQTPKANLTKYLPEAITFQDPNFNDNDTFYEDYVEMIFGSGENSSTDYNPNVILSEDPRFNHSQTFDDYSGLLFGRRDNVSEEYDNHMNMTSENISYTDVDAVSNTILIVLNKTADLDPNNETSLPKLDFTHWTNNFADYLSYLLFNNDNNSTNITDPDSWNATANISESLETTDSTTTELYYASSNYFPSFSSTTEDNFTTIPSSTSDIYGNYSTVTKSDNSSGYWNCTMICEEETLHEKVVEKLNYTARRDLRKLCWETMFGQELVKLTVMDLLFTVLSTVGMDCIRAVFVRYMNRCWCWDLEKKFPQYGDFKVAENILHLVNNQGMVWMGMFFSPGVVLLNSIKLFILMYFRAWVVLSFNVPHEIIFRASRSNNFYYALLLMMLFLCVLPVGYAIVWIKPSWHCGPFSNYDKIFLIFTTTIKGALPQFENVLNYIASPGTVIPLLVLLILIIYYLVSLTAALREANNDLKIQLRRERTEERRKMFQIADRRRRGGSGGSGESNPCNKWKVLLERLPSGKSLDETPRLESDDVQAPAKEEKVENNKTKDFFSKLVKKALGKSSTSEEEINHNVDDGTDTEQHESLPEDLVSIRESKSSTHKPLKPTVSSGSADLQKAAASVLVNKRNQKKLENLRGSTESSETKHVHIQQHLPKHSSSSSKHDSRKPYLKRQSVELPSTSRQDSGSSLWSDNIPVIKISKTDSAENILKETSPKRYGRSRSTNGSSEKPESHRSSTDISHRKSDVEDKFKPKIKYALKKQSSEIDEDMIFHFGKDAEGALYSSLGPETIDDANRPHIMPSAPSYEELMIDKSSSDDTEAKESSQGTILNAPYMTVSPNGEPKNEGAGPNNVRQTSTVSVDTQRSLTQNGSSTQTESSSGYKDSSLS